ncbi:plastidial pyruvate kinase 2-like isoform A [Chlorella sorokiniana]|uniref:Pyruvate kinase n=1 Tax=Chlorella sorokiniana TaxID=3076 RepID=A0A2P6TQP5_CHLSO|nr:plastidial pyruvate kinase 2-like isoform A [Chlorella sorokiniana]|eukprot:PRW56390.1 plastidial pyruvate kinase 2-like isoform A [Chlorella sorokiniana]
MRALSARPGALACAPAARRSPCATRAAAGHHSQPAPASRQQRGQQQERAPAPPAALAGRGLARRGGGATAEAAVEPELEIDLAAFADYSGNLPARKTKVVATIGPTSCERESLFRLADAGMSVVRLNMSHGTHDTHKAVVDLVREYNSLGRGNLAIMMDTKGPEVRSGDVHEPLQLAAGDRVTFTILEGADGSDNRVSVNYDDFINDAGVGDMLLVDGGIMSMQIERITDTDVECTVVDGGTLGSRRHLNIRGKSANLPAITDRDWADIKFGIEIGVDYYALSFVRDAEVIYELKSYLAQEGLTGTSAIGVLAKIESADSVEHLDEILDAVDGAMVARGDLGAELPVEDVPYWQSKIVQGCRRRGKPVIVATNMLESMISNPTPTRAEVSDIAIAVREGADAIMLSGETAYGKFPFKSLDTMTTVARRTELSMLQYQGTRRHGSDESPPIDWIIPPGRRQLTVSDHAMSEVFAFHSVTMANTLKTSLVVFTRKGNMPALLSHYRPDYPIYCFTENELIQRRMALYHGVTAMYLKFSEQQEVTFDRAITLLKERGHVKGGQLLAIVQSGRQPIWRTTSMHAIQVRAVPEDPLSESDQESDGQYPVKEQP